MEDVEVREGELKDAPFGAMAIETIRVQPGDIVVITLLGMLGRELSFLLQGNWAQGFTQRLKAAGASDVLFCNEHTRIEALSKAVATAEVARFAGNPVS